MPATTLQHLTNARRISHPYCTAIRQNSVSIALWLTNGHGAIDIANMETVDPLWAAHYLKRGTMTEADTYQKFRFPSRPSVCFAKNTFKHTWCAQ